MRITSKIGWILLLAAGVVAAVIYTQSAVGDGDRQYSGVETPVQEGTQMPEEFHAVDLDRLIDQEVERVREMDGRRQIKMASPISFTARIRRYPEEKQMTYIYTALEIAGIRPLPEVGHQMFVESANGRIISVYVEKKTAIRIPEKLAVEETVRIWGYHVYSYAKGPAVLVVGAEQGKADAK